MSQVLSRIPIIEGISEGMPTCVLVEILEAHGIIYDEKRLTDEAYLCELTAGVLNTEVVAVPHHSYTVQQLCDIARFVNRKHDWLPSRLLKAFKFLMRFSLPGEQLTLPFSCGQQTNEEVAAVNACILYKNCKLFGIITSRNTTMQEMYQAVMLVLSPYPLLDAVRSFISVANKKELVNILMLNNRLDICEYYPIVAEEAVVSHSDIERCALRFSRPGAMLQCILPITEAEAIYLAASNYRIDLSGARSPKEEYSYLRVDPERYSPHDERLSHFHRRNPKLINLNETFNPLFPLSCYGSVLITELAEKEGFTEGSAYEYLQLRHITEGFHSGWYPTVTNKQTPFLLEEVEELSPQEVISFGVKSESLIALTFTELTQLFSNNLTFTNPLSPSRAEPFSPLCVDQLLRIAQRSNNELFSVIRKIRTMDELEDERKRSFVRRYRTAGIAQRNRISNALQLLLSASMFMRGWNGKSALPIEETPVENQSEVDIRVTQAIFLFEEHPEAAEIKLLPLVRWMNDRFITATRNEGSSIGERVEMVKRGENFVNIKSCIRISSLWLASSAYHYLEIVGERPSFDIRKLREIA